MPIPVSYPGVYVQEVSSGVHTITGVATSVTAFVGRTLRGPLDTDGPDGVLTVNGFPDFQRVYGGIWSGSPLSFAVRDFFLNGGGQAVIVRVYLTDGNPPAATLHLPVSGGGPFDLVAANPGSWGNKLQARVDHDVSDPTDATLFNLYVRDGNTAQVEEFRNVSMDPAAPRAVDKVLAASSSLVRAVAPLVSPAGTVPDANDPPSPTDPLWGTESSNTTNTWVDTGTAADLGSDGKELAASDIIDATLIGSKQGIYALEHADLFNLLCLPPFTLKDTQLVDAAAYCQSRRAVLIVDPPPDWTLTDAAKTSGGFADLAGGFGTTGRYAACYFPSLQQPDPTRDNQLGVFPPSGAVAGVIARTDAQRGVWKAPAGLDASVLGAPALSVPLTDAENGQLNPLGLNCLRSFPLSGRVVWGARTLRGADRLADDWKYLPVRRTALYIEESLYRGTQWVVFEPNDEPLWAQIRLNVGAFMQGLFRQGAFQGSTPKEAYFVKCDKETTTQSDINSGVVNVVVGFAPLKPAEFVVITVQQLAGQITV
jgi:phage tail sheath protein FI